MYMHIYPRGGIGLEASRPEIRTAGRQSIFMENGRRHISTICAGQMHACITICVPGLRCGDG